MTKRIAYLRVSTHEQRPDRQIDGLRLLCDEFHVEVLSACNHSRPVYEMVIAKLQPGDTLVVWDLDRAFRSTVDALTEIETLRQRGVAFHIANFNLDTSTPAGVFVYTLLSALAEFERRTLSQRTREGLAAARRRGKRLGRPPILNDAQLKDAADRAAAGVSFAAIARDLGVHSWTLSRALRRHFGETFVDDLFQS